MISKKLIPAVSRRYVNLQLKKAKEMEIIQGDWPTGKSDINDLKYLPICSCDICIQENNKIILQKEHKYCRFCKTIKPEKDFVSLKFNKTIYIYIYIYRCISCHDKLLIQRMGGSRDRCKKPYKD